MASQNKSFLASGQKEGVEIWRIENFEAVPIDKKTYGTFFSGDSYLILETLKNKYGRLQRNLFFWLGKESSQDEKGTAAYKAVELDDVHKGEPVQFREVQGHESSQFQAVFKRAGGLRVCAGGIASGFNSVDPDAYEPRLFQCKGKRNVLVTQVEMKSASLNEGDVFILDCGLTLFRWVGKEANKYEKFKSMEVANKVKDEERGGKAKIVILNSGSDEGSEAEEFWKVLGSRSAVKSAAEGGSDKKKRKKPTLVEISDATGQMEFKEMKVSTKSGKLEKSMLRTDDVFIIDVGYKIYVWIGKGANKAEKKESMKFATKYLADKKYPDWTTIERINERAEPPAFKELFFMWKKPRRRSVTTDGKTVEQEKPKDVAAEALFKVCKEAEEKMIDANGKVEQWRIENLKRVKVPDNSKGQFFDGDSYIVLYTYEVRGKEAYIIYFWQGGKSSTDEKAASALLSRQIDDDLGGAPVQVRVTQGHEPKHFMAIFGGQMIIRKGGHARYHVKSLGGAHTRTVQTEEDATALNSGDCFVLLTPKQMFVWQGLGSNAEERKSATAVADLLKGSRTMSEFEEGKEPDAFWEAIGGKKEYAKSKLLEDESREPRLFHLSGNTGALYAEEIFNFSQADLINDDVMMLDLYSEVFVWIGSDAQAQETESALRLALDYAKKNPDGRNECPTYQIQAGYEPPTFTAHFVAWDTEISDQWYKIINQIKPTDKKEEAAPDFKRNASKLVTADSVGFLDPKSNKFPLSELQAGVPDRVDPARKELYLEEAEFKKHFGVSIADYMKWKPWKQKGQKKKHKLF